MKRNGRKLLVSSVVALLVFLLICLGVFSTNRPYFVETTTDTATIRLPGEFHGETSVSYNSKYVEESEKDSVLTLKFRKSGYYRLSVGPNDYIFEVLNIDSSDYTVDLIEAEYVAIKLCIILEKLILSAILWLACFVMYFAVRVAFKKPKIEKSKEFRVE